MKKAYYSIGEVSEILELKAYVIRYWETEFSQIKPKKVNGRTRKYTNEDIEVLKLIKHVLYDKRFTIDGARQYLKELAHQQECSTPISTQTLSIHTLIKELQSIREILTNNK